MKLFLTIFFCFLFLNTFSQCSFNIQVIQYPSCQFNNDGILTAANLQGVPPFSFLWSNGSTTNSIDNIQADYYSVTITDSLNCIATNSIFLSSGNLQFTYNIIPPSCSFCIDGLMSAIVNTGTPPFTYLWSTSENTQSIQIGQDSYACCVMDAEGCITCHDAYYSGVDSLNGVRISGTIYLDNDSSGSFTPPDYPLSQWPVLLLPDSLVSFSDVSGNYCLYLDSGDYSLKALYSNFYPDTNYVLFSDSAEYHVAVHSITQNGFDFGMTCEVCTHQLQINMIPAIDHCRSDSIKHIFLRNLGPFAEDVKVQFIHSANSVYHDSWPYTAVVSGDTVTWTIPHLIPLSSVHINVQLSLPTVGAIADYTIIASSTDSLGVVLTSYTDIVQHTITCSYDPNEKTVLPEGVDSAHYTLYNSLLKYLIQFQNTGTDTAYRVTLVDTLDTSLDLTTFSLIGSSHQVRVLLDPVSRIVQFTFINIMLPDSNINLSGSNGFVYFSILPKQGLVLPSVVRNDAYIYFDENVPVKTDVAYNTLVDSLVSVPFSGYENAEVKIYPSPADNFLIAKLNDSSLAINYFEIDNLLGIKIISETTNSNSIIISVNNIEPGIYFLKMILSEGKKVIVKKFVIE